MTQVRILNADDVRALLPMDVCIDLMREAFRAVAEKRAAQPIRQMTPAFNGRGVLAWMPGALSSPDSLGVKVLTIYPGNFGTELSSHQGAVLLFDASNGAPRALIDAREITAIRTAAATAAATDALAPSGARSLALFGYGEQAASHLEAIGLVRRIEKVFVWGRDLERARAFARTHAAQAELIAVATAEEASEADILCLTTAAAEPYFRGAWLRAGHHLNAVGSSVATTSEVDVEAVVRARYFVDFEDSAKALAGDFKRALDTGAIQADHMLGSVGEVLIGALRGRSAADEITFFKSLGMVAEDLLAADYILTRAKADNRGAVVDW